MTYDTETYTKSISALADEELIKRLHLGSFSEQALPIALAEASRRNLPFNPEESQSVVDGESNLRKERRFNKFVWLVSVPMAAVGAATLGLFGGIALLFLGRFSASFLDRRVDSPFAKGAMALALVVATFFVCVAMKAALRAGGGLPAT